MGITQKNGHEMKCERSNFSGLSALFIAVIRRFLVRCIRDLGICEAQSLEPVNRASPLHRVVFVYVQPLARHDYSREGEIIATNIYDDFQVDFRYSSISAGN